MFEFALGSEGFVTRMRPVLRRKVALKEVPRHQRFADRPETNLHYNYFRNYDSGIGRYIESDPIGLKGGINTYGYAGGDPILSSDSLEPVMDLR